MQELNRDHIGADEIDLVDLFQVIKKRRKFIAVFVAVCTAIAVIYSLLAPKLYKATAVIMPVGPSGGGISSMMGGSMGGLAALMGVGAGVQTPTQQMMALLKTRSLAESVIKKNDLLPILIADQDSSFESVNGTPEALIMQMAVSLLLDGYVMFEEGKDVGTISINAEFGDPKIAANVAQSYVDGLGDFLTKNAVTVAKRNRIFIEEQLSANKQELLDSGKALNEFYRNERISDVDSSIDVSISGPSNKELSALQNKINEVDKRLEEYKILKDVPQQVYLQYLNLRKTLLTQIHSLLTQQYEMAKIQESKEDLSFQVIDPPKVPEIRSKPKRKLIVLVSMVASVFMAVFIAFAIEYIQKFRTELRSRSA